MLKKILDLNLREKTVQLVVVVILVFIAYLSRILINPFVSDLSFRYLLFIIAVILSSWLVNYWGGLLALTLSLVIINFLPPFSAQNLRLTSGKILAEDLIFLLLGIAVIIFIDVLNRRQRKLSLKASDLQNQRLNLLIIYEEVINILNSIGDAFLYLDNDWKFRYINREALVLFQTEKAKSLINRDSRKYLKRYFNRDSLTKIKSALQAKNDVRFEYFEKLSQRWFQIRLYPTASGLSIYITDISLRKAIQSERDVVFSELNNLVDIAPIGIGFTDNNLKFNMVNRMFATILDEPEESYINRTPSEVCDKKIAQDMEKSMKQVLSVKKIKSQEIETHYDKNRTFWKITYYPFLIGKNNEGLGIVADDITSDKNEQNRKDTFFSIVSHELKTPVTAIKAFLQILEKLPPRQQSKRKEYFEKVNKHVNRLNKLINDVLDISKIKSKSLTIVKEHFDFDQLLEDIVNTYQLTARAHRIRLSGKTGKIVYADRDRISQVVINLINNAIKYSPHQPQIIIKIYSDQKSVYCSIRDFGIGIDRKEVEKIFNSFYRIDDTDQISFPGLGIGLYVSNEIIKSHRGKIRVDSQKNKGSVFTFSIPIK